MLWRLMCVTFVKPFIFVGMRRVKTWLFYKSDSQSFIDRWNRTLNSTAIKPFGHCHPWYLVCSNHLNAMSIPWKICFCLANMLLITYHTSRHITTTVCTCQVLFHWESFIFVMCFPWQTQIAQCLQCKAFTHLPFGFLSCFKVRCL